VRLEQSDLMLSSRSLSTTPKKVVLKMDDSNNPTKAESTETSTEKVAVDKSEGSKEKLMVGKEGDTRTGKGKTTHDLTRKHFEGRARSITRASLEHHSKHIHTRGGQERVGTRGAVVVNADNYGKDDTHNIYNIGSWGCLCSIISGILQMRIMGS
jgi:hypothetical protein